MDFSAETREHLREHLLIICKLCVASVMVECEESHSLYIGYLVCDFPR